MYSYIQSFNASKHVNYSLFTYEENPNKGIMSVTHQKFIRLERCHRLKDYYNFAAQNTGFCMEELIEVPQM